MKICIINFSGRRDGNCHDIAGFIKQSLEQNHDVTLFEICDLDVSPCGKCDYECLYKDKICPYAGDDISAIYDALCASNLTYFVLPNYIDYPNSYFFIFNERKQGYFAQKPGLYLDIPKKFVVVSSTEQDNFKHILGRHNANSSDADFLFLAAKDFDKGGVKGGIMESEQAKQLVRGFIS